MRRCIGYLGCLALGAAAPAHAQTALTLYGYADLGLEWINHLPPDGAGARRVSSSGESSSRLGLRGSEALGPGLRAVFQLESGVNLDEGVSTQAGRLFGRTTYVGIEQDGVGRLTIGRNQNMAMDFGIWFDPLGRPSRYASNTLDLGYVSRTDNAVKYAAGFGPAYVSAMYGAGEVAGTARAGRYYGALGSYQWQGWRLGLGMEAQAGATAATADDETRRSMLGATYADGGGSKLGAGYTWRTNHVAGVRRRIGQSWLGFQSVPAPAWYLAATLYLANLPGTSDDPKNLTVLLSYFLSRRTDLYLTLGHAWNRGSSNIGVTAFGTVLPGQPQTGIMAGICHQF
jgi:predicted porin